VTLHQLKPLHESFYNIIFGKLRSLDAIIVCEGATEAEIVKVIAKKLKLGESLKLGVTDSEGLTNVPKVTSAVVVLVTLARRLKAIGVLVDAENMDSLSRARSIVDSMRSQNINVNHLKPLESGECTNVYEASIVSSQVKLVIVVSGDPSLPFKTHTIEDHGVKLKILGGHISIEELSNYENAKEIMRREDLIREVEQSKPEHVREAFKNIYCAIKHVEILAETV